ncbi:MAG: DUF47 family protein [Syntrophales bacterium]|nr:DUF47 family protein [Syntrophales bacterium]
MSFNLLDSRFRFHELLMEQFGKWQASAALLTDIFTDPNCDVASACKEIHHLAADARNIARDIMGELSLVQIRQIERQDIHDLSMAQEKAINSVKAVATRIGMYGFQHVQKPIRELTANLQEITAEVHGMLKKLHTRDSNEETIQKLAEIKKEADLFLLVAMGELFESQGDLSDTFLDILKWTQVYDRMEEAIEDAIQVTNVIEAMQLKKV